MTWTLDDERQLRDMEARRQNYYRTMEECVERCVVQHFYDDTGLDRIVTTLIENATQIRKVLEPFDKEFEDA